MGKPKKTLSYKKKEKSKYMLTNPIGYSGEISQGVPPNSIRGLLNAVNTWYHYKTPDWLRFLLPSDSNAILGSVAPIGGINSLLNKAESGLKALPELSGGIKTVKNVPKTFWRGIEVPYDKNVLPQSLLDVGYSKHQITSGVAPNPYVSSDEGIANAFGSPNPITKKFGVVNKYVLNKANPKIITYSDAEKILESEFKGKPYTKDQAQQVLRKRKIDGIYDDYNYDESGYQFLNHDDLQLKESVEKKWISKGNSDWGELIKKTKKYKYGGEMGKPNTKNKSLPKDYSQTDTTFIKNIYPFGYNDYSGSYRTIPNMADWKQIAMNPMFLKSNLGYITSPEDQAKALGVIRDRLSNMPGQEPYVRYLDSLSYNKDTTGIHNLLNEYKGFSNPLPEKFLSEYTKQYADGGTVRESFGEKKPLSSAVSDVLFPSAFREKVVNSMYPYGYLPEPVKFTKAFFSPESNNEPVRLDTNKESNRHRYDAVRLYSDLPQEYDTFDKSEYRPTKGKDTKRKDTVYYKFKSKEDEKKYVELAAKYGLLDKQPGTNINFTDNGVTGNSVMNTGTLGYGVDEKGPYVSYADKWDLALKDNIPVARNMFGRPFNIYGRVYLSKNEIESLKKKYSKTVDPYLINSDNISGQAKPIKSNISNRISKQNSLINNYINSMKRYGTQVESRDQKYGLGGTIGSLAGTAIGGPLGSMVFGTLGNVVDSIIGSNKAAKEQQAQADLVKKQQEQAKLDQIEGLQSSSTFSNPFAPTFPFGGLMGYGQAELEKQEAFQTPSGEGAVVNAPTHNEGGIKLELPYGTRIYSDRLKKGNSTFADLAEPLIKLRKKYEK